uniref:TIR domain-containing protein n=1 Tax=Megaselia scalaris TaxID=36166 RepID=T1GBC3_MEGSC
MLDLRNNSFKYLDQHFLDQIEEFEVPTYLSGNDWKCDCDNLTFIDIIRNTSQIIDEIYCWVNDRTKILTKISPDHIQFICEGSSYAYEIIILSTFLVIFAISSTSVYFRREIRIWFFAHRVCLWCISEDEVDKDRTYDAFVCFQEKDEHFVERIVEVLESGPNPYKLCIHFRDWMVGEYISAQIVKSVENSKRTIFIITSNFLDSVWSRLEFRTACAASLREKIPRIIVILCQEIEELGKLDPEIKAYFNSNTYLKWNDPLFWSRLQYALPHRKHEVSSNDIEMVDMN